MIGNLAHKRTSLVAVATLIALIAAMFVAWGATQAQTSAVGNVSASSGWCLLNTTPDPDAHQLSSTRDSFTALTVTVADEPDDDPNDLDSGTAGIQHAISCSAANVNMHVSVAPNGSRFPAVTYNTHEVVVSFGTSPRAGTSTVISAYVKSPLAGASYTAPAAALLATVSPPNSGAAITDSASGDVAADGAISIDPAAPTQIRSLTLLSTASGEFLVTVNALYATGARNVNGTKSVTVGETAAVADTKVASATLALDYVDYDTLTTTRNEAIPESDTKPAGANGNIWLKLTIANSLGDPAENTDLDSVTVFAPNATLGLYTANAAGTQRIIPVAQLGSDGLHVVSRSETDTPGTEEVTKTMYVRISSTSPTQTSVYAQINGKVRSNSVDLTFTGPAASIEVSEASKTLSSKSGNAEGAGITFTVTAKDAADNEGVALLTNQVNLRVLDADGERVASNPTAAKAQGKKADGSADNTKVIVTITTSATKAAASGEYTLEATLGSNQKTTQTATFNVAGPPANIELSADPESADEPGTATLTAVVTDEAGVSVADGTMVKFSALGGGASLITAADVATKDGQATAKLGVTGPGSTIVYATSGEAADELTFVSTAGQVEAAQVAVAATVTLADVEAELSYGDSVTVTATVADEDGNAVPNGTLVTFTVHGGGTLFSPRTVGTIDGNASADIVALSDDVWVRAFSGTASSGTMQIAVESAAEEAARVAQEEEDARVADAEDAAADAAATAAAEAEKASDAADAAAAADSPEDAQSAADDAAAAATAAQEAADAAQESADSAGTDAAQESADAAQESADAAQKSADDAQAAADAAAQAAADAEAQAEADRQAEIAAGVEAALEAQVDEVSIDCLSNLTGFATWTCNVGSTASEVFALVADRGATAVHLWNGSAWVRFAIVNGDEVPGSSDDFMIAEDDILYISN